MENSPASPALALVPAARRGESVPAVARPEVAVLRPCMGPARPSRLPFERWLNIGIQLSAAWVARRFGKSRRRDTLHFSHHAEVAALAEPEQDFWLRKAEAHNWPVLALAVATPLGRKA